MARSGLKSTFGLDLSKLGLQCGQMSSRAAVGRRCGTVPAVTPSGSVPLLVVPALSVSRVKGSGIVIWERISQLLLYHGIIKMILALSPFSVPNMSEEI